MRYNRFVAAATLAVLFTGLGARLDAQAVKPAAAAEGGYQLPPKVIVDILDARPLPSVIVSPTRQQLALLDRPSMPTIADLSQPMLRLAGMRINPKTNGPQRSQGITAITLKAVADGKETNVVVPVGAKIDAVSFSPGRQASVVHPDQARGRRAVDCRHRHRPGQVGHHGQPERHHGRPVRLGRRGHSALQFRSGEPGSRAQGPGGPGRAEHPGELRQGRTGQHLPGPARQRPRRGALRVLLHQPAGPG